MNDARVPYTAQDRALVEAYLARNGRHLLDPLGGDADDRDVVFGPSLASARRHFRYACDARRRDGISFRV